MAEFDIIFSSGESRVEKFLFKDKEVSVTIKEIGWAEKNRVLSQCFQYQHDGTIKFDFDKYNKEMLKKVVVKISVGGSDVPQGEMNDIFFARLNSSFGSMLEKLVPRAFEETSTTDFFAKG
jgi:hypothetical protein